MPGTISSASPTSANTPPGRRSVSTRLPLKVTSCTCELVSPSLTTATPPGCGACRGGGCSCSGCACTWTAAKISISAKHHRARSVIRKYLILNNYFKRYLYAVEGDFDPVAFQQRQMPFHSGCFLKSSITFCAVRSEVLVRG